MKLFKNGVGRPSNDTIKKRRIFVVLIIVLCFLTCVASFVLVKTYTNKAEEAQNKNIS